jgi:hypothetical protein
MKNFKLNRETLLLVIVLAVIIVYLILEALQLKSKISSVKKDAQYKGASNLFISVRYIEIVENAIHTFLSLFFLGMIKRINHKEILYTSIFRKALAV